MYIGSVLHWQEGAHGWRQLESPAGFKVGSEEGGGDGGGGGGGVGKIHRVAVGVLILAALGNGLSLMGVSSATTLLVNGCVLGFVVLMNGNMTGIRLNFMKKLNG